MKTVEGSGDLKVARNTTYWKTRSYTVYLPTNGVCTLLYVNPTSHKYHPMNK